MVVQLQCVHPHTHARLISAILCVCLQFNAAKAFDVLERINSDTEQSIVAFLLQSAYITCKHSQFYAAKAFDVLERLDPDPEYLEGKRGGIAGTFQVSKLPLNALLVCACVCVCAIQIISECISVIRCTHTDSVATSHRPQAIVAGKEPRDGIKDLLAMLRTSASNPQMDTIARIIRAWGMENGCL